MNNLFTVVLIVLANFATPHVYLAQMKVVSIIDNLFSVWRVDLTDDIDNDSFTMFVQAENEEEAIYKVGGSKQFIDWLAEREQRGLGSWRGQASPFMPQAIYRSDTAFQFHRENTVIVCWWVNPNENDGDESDCAVFNFSVEPSPKSKPSPFTRFKFLNQEQEEAWKEEYFGVKPPHAKSSRVQGPQSLLTPPQRTWRQCPKDIKSRVGPGSLFGIGRGKIVATVNDISTVLGFKPEDWRYQDESGEGRGSRWDFLIGDISDNAIGRLRATEGNPFLDQTDTLICGIWDYRSFYTGEVIDDKSPLCEFNTNGPHQFFEAVFGRMYTRNGYQGGSLIDKIAGLIDPIT